jgi:TetR/AcrR family transcriptional repressor of multidrug resistance operon
MVEKGKTKQQCVVDAARRLLAAEGLHGLSIKLLVKESGVAAGTIYLHFKDKQDIVRQVHASVIQEVAHAMSQNHDAAQPLFMQYRTLWLNLWAYFQKRPNTLLVKAQFDNLPDVSLRQILQEAKSSFKEIYQMFETGRQTGELKNLPDDVLGSLSFETCATLARRQVLGIIEMNHEMLEQCISASWQAITNSSVGKDKVGNTK